MHLLQAGYSPFGRKGLQFELLMLGIDFEREELESLAPGAKTFPQILVNGVSIGGYEDLLEKLTVYASETVNLMTVDLEDSTLISQKLYILVFIGIVCSQSFSP